MKRTNCKKSTFSEYCELGTCESQIYDQCNRFIESFEPIDQIDTKAHIFTKLQCPWYFNNMKLSRAHQTALSFVSGQFEEYKSKYCRELSIGTGDLEFPASIERICPDTGIFHHINRGVSALGPSVLVEVEFTP